MLVVFVHIVFGFCLLLSAVSADVEQVNNTEQIADNRYEDRIDPMYNQEDK